MTRFRVGVAALILLIFLAFWLAYKSGDDKKWFTISKETTYITEPVDQDGYLDYAAALNDILGQGITKDNNVMAALCEVHGPRPEGGGTQDMDPEFYRRLGIEAPPAEGPYFGNWQKFLRAIKDLDPDEYERLDKVFEDLTVRPWTTQQSPHPAAWLKANEKPINLGVEATRRPKYYYPLIPGRSGKYSRGLITSLVPHVQKNRELAAAFVMRATLHLGEGRTDAAWNDLMACHRLARLAANGSTLIESLVGFAMEWIATETTLGFLEHDKPDAKSLRRRWQEWKLLPVGKPMSANLDLTERFTALETALMTQRFGPDFLQHFTSTKKPPPLRPAPMRGILFDPALMRINELYDRLTAAFQEMDYLSRRNAVQEIVTEVNVLWTELKDRGGIAGIFDSPEQRGDRMGDIVAGVFIPGLGKALDAEERLVQARRNLDTAFALAAFRLDRGTYPKSLAELVPDYLKDSPLDHFTGDPLTYRHQANGYLLYSFGPNGLDDDARIADDRPPADDIAVRIPRPARPKNDDDKMDR